MGRQWGEVSRNAELMVGQICSKEVREKTAGCKWWMQVGEAPGKEREKTVACKWKYCRWVRLKAQRLRICPMIGDDGQQQLGAGGLVQSGRKPQQLGNTTRRHMRPCSAALWSRSVRLGGSSHVKLLWLRLAGDHELLRGGSHCGRLLARTGGLHAHLQAASRRGEGGDGSWAGMRCAWTCRLTASGAVIPLGSSGAGRPAAPGIKHNPFANMRNNPVKHSASHLQLARLLAQRAPRAAEVGAAVAGAAAALRLEPKHVANLAPRLLGHAALHAAQAEHAVAAAVAAAAGQGGREVGSASSQSDAGPEAVGWSRIASQPS